MTTPGILLIGNYPPPFGGVPKHLESLVPELVRCGWDVHVLSGGTTGTVRGEGFTVCKDPRPALPRRIGTLRFLAHSVFGGRSQPVLRAARMLPYDVWFRTMTRVSLAAGIIESHDIRVISAYNLLHGAPVGALAAEMYGLPLVVTNLGEIYSHRPAVQQQLRMIRHVTDVATVLTTLTDHCARSYRELGITREVRVLRYGIDRERFGAATTGEGIRARFAIPPSDDVVLYLGRLVRDMGLQVLLDGLPSLLERRPATHVLIAGGSGELDADAIAATSRWPGRVSVAVDVPERELARFYAAATLVVAPTIGARACGSLAAAEAMAAGKPVVASRVGGIPEYVEDGVTGVLVPPADAPALVDAIVTLLEDRPRLAELGRRGRDRAAALFDVRRTNAALEQLFRETAGLR